MEGLFGMLCYGNGVIEHSTPFFLCIFIPWKNKSPQDKKK